MAWTFTSSGAAIAKAGIGSNADIILSGARLAEWSNMSEGRIVSETRRDWRVSYASLGTDIKNILDDVSSSMMAKNIINYDMSGYTSRAEAIMMLNVNDDIVREGIKVLKDFKSNDIKPI